ALSDHDLAAITSYADKAVGWMFVAVGGLLLALDQTYRLTDDHSWPTAAFWPLSAVASTSCAGVITGLHRRGRGARTRRSAS
ncbi:MAG TPA: hypothetical protein VGE11_22980, partial [Pseudonocardia sp.]